MKKQIRKLEYQCEGDQETRKMRKIKGHHSIHKTKPGKRNFTKIILGCLLINGTTDPLVPYNGDEVEVLGKKRWPYMAWRLAISQGKVHRQDFKRYKCV